jgi:hypothetical protein
MCSAGMAWQVNDPQAMSNFCWDPPLPWVHFLNCWWHPAARCQSLDQSFSAPVASTMASLLGTSWCSNIWSLPLRFASLFSRQPSSPCSRYLSQSSPFLDGPPVLLGRPYSLLTRHSFWLPSFPDGLPSRLLSVLSWLLVCHKCSNSMMYTSISPIQSV